MPGHRSFEARNDDVRVGSYSPCVGARHNFTERIEVSAYAVNIGNEESRWLCHRLMDAFFADRSPRSLVLRIAITQKIVWACTFPTLHAARSPEMRHAEIRRFIRHGTLVQLSVFETVARLGNFTQAGKELHMAQPTVSMHVKKLSEAVGLALFEPVGRSFKMTQAGRELHAACHEIFQKIHDVEQRLASLRVAGTDKLRLAVSTTAKYFAPRLLAHFWEIHPGIEIAMMPMNREQLLHRLEADLDDFYVLSNPPEDLEVDMHALLPNRLFLYARDDHPLAEQCAIAPSRLRGEPMLMRESGSGTRMTANDFFAAHQIVPKVAMELGSNEAIKQAILAGLGIALLSHNSMGNATRKSHIVALDVAGLPIERHWYLVHRRDRVLTSMAEQFLRHSTDAQLLREISELDS